MIIMRRGSDSARSRPGVWLGLGRINLIRDSSAACGGGCLGCRPRPAQHAAAGVCHGGAELRLDSARRSLRPGPELEPGVPVNRPSGRRADVGPHDRGTRRVIDLSNEETRADASVSPTRRPGGRLLRGSTSS
jgi:hypothetical protein